MFIDEAQDASGAGKQARAASLAEIYPIQSLALILGPIQVMKRSHPRYLSNSSKKKIKRFTTILRYRKDIPQKSK
jgi:hypothetical protein